MQPIPSFPMDVLVSCKEEGSGQRCWLFTKVYSPTGTRRISCGIMLPARLESCFPPSARLPTVQGTSLHTVCQFVFRSHVLKFWYDKTVIRTPSVCDDRSPYVQQDFAKLEGSDVCPLQRLTWGSQDSDRIPALLLRIWETMGKGICVVSTRDVFILKYLLPYRSGSSPLSACFSISGIRLRNTRTNERWGMFPAHRRFPICQGKALLFLTAPL